MSLIYINSKSAIARLIVGKESGKIENERVKMESIGNNESTVYGTQKSVSLREKVCEASIYINDQNTPNFLIPPHFPCVTKRTLTIHNLFLPLNGSSL